MYSQIKHSQKIQMAIKTEIQNKIARQLINYDPDLTEEQVFNLIDRPRKLQ